MCNPDQIRNYQSYQQFQKWPMASRVMASPSNASSIEVNQKEGAHEDVVTDLGAFIFRNIGLDTNTKFLKSQNQALVEDATIGGQVLPVMEGRSHEVEDATHKEPVAI